MYLGVDPGETTGYALMETPEKMHSWGHVKFDDIFDWLENLPAGIEVIIMESFQLFGHKAKAQTGSKMKTSQVIGAVKAYAHRHKITVVEQPPTIKAFAEKQSGLKPTGAHANSHRIDAFNHCYYYFLQKKLLQVRTS